MAGLSGAGRALMDPLRRSLDIGSVDLAAKAADVVPAALGQDAKVRGALLTAQQMWLQS